MLRVLSQISTEENNHLDIVGVQNGNNESKTMDGCHLGEHTHVYLGHFTTDLHPIWFADH